jgi:uroporphyrinogen-III synthase
VSTEDIQLLKQSKIDIIVATSGEILQNFITLTKGMHWQTVPLVVISERMVGMAKMFGFEKILLANNASLPAIMSILEDNVCQMKNQ